MNRSKWTGIPIGERFEQCTGMQDPRLVVLDEEALQRKAAGKRASNNGRPAEPSEDDIEYAIGQYTIDLDTLPDLTVHPDPRAELVLAALLRICCPCDEPPTPTSPPPVPMTAPLSAPQTV